MLRETSTLILITTTTLIHYPTLLRPFESRFDIPAISRYLGSCELEGENNIVLCLTASG